MLQEVTFGEGTPDVAILSRQNALQEGYLREHYIEPLGEFGIPPERFIAFPLAYEATGKAPVGRCIKPHLAKLEKPLQALGIKTILVCDGPYFKTMCKVGKVEPHLGYVKDTIWEGVQALYVPSAKALFHNPNLQPKIDLALKAVGKHLTSKESIFHEDIIREGTYCYVPQQAKNLLREVLKAGKPLTADIETSGLRLGSDLLSIAFGSDQHTGFAILLSGLYSTPMKNILREFFEAWTGPMIWHNGTFDVKQLIWHLFMDGPEDYDGMVRGLEIFFDQHEYHDTKALTYLATNSCAGNELGLKAQAFDFVGNYALDEMDNLEKVPREELLKYNLRDVLATWYVFNKHRETVRNEQESVYQDVFLPSLKTICQMEMVGLPLNRVETLETERSLGAYEDDLLRQISGHPLVVNELNWTLRLLEAEKANLKLKKTRKTPEDFERTVSFNPGSPLQLQIFLHKQMGLPVIEYTDTKQPATGNDVLKKHIQHLERSEEDKRYEIELLQLIVDWSDVAKITNTFIAAFLVKTVTRDGWAFLVGNFNLGGAKSGRLSSSDPNLQNIPSTGTQYAKAVKRCVQAPPGWIFVGADYNSLEDRIGALLSKDPNKLAVYTDGYDGHSLRALSYFPERMPDIVEEMKQATRASERVSIVNSIGDRYPDLRQLSKGPTFALTYLGTYKTLVQNFGLTEEEARQIEDNYHQLYHVADAWAAQQMYLAHQRGYAELAFGLRLRTPLLPQVLWEDESSWPFEAYQEKKTATNALGQSYGLLNSHTGNLFMQRVWASPYRTSILPCAHIHDAQYYLVRDNLTTLHWLNINLIECMEWNELEPIQHDEVKLGAELEVYYPDWSNPIAIPNRASREEIKSILKEAV